MNEKSETNDKSDTKSKKKNEKESSVNLHKGHRKKLRNRMMKEGLDNFEEHNVVEALLFESIPVRDTNEIAHRLINHCGSITDVFEASPEKLMEVNGIAERSARLIKLIPQIASRLSISRNEQNPVLDASEKIYDFVKSQGYIIKSDKVYVVFLDSGSRFMKIETFDVEGSDFIPISTKRLIEMIVKYKYDSIAIVLCCHSLSQVSPSRLEMQKLNDMTMLFKQISCRIVDVVIASPNSYMSLYHF